MSITINRIKNKIDNVGIKGYLIYVVDSEKMNCTLHPLTSLNPSLRFKETNELFWLENPLFFFESKPVFMVIHGFNISIRVEQQIEGSETLVYEELPIEIEDSLRDKLDKIGNTYKANKFVLESKQKRFKLVERGYSPTEVHDRINSQYTRHLFKPSRLPTEWLIGMFLIVIISILTTVLIMSSQPAKIVEVIRYINQTITIPSNSTLGVRFL
jgi:hypothetical protein